MTAAMSLQERLERRRAELTAELERGRRVLADLDAQRAAVRDTLLRLTGAIEVLTEELAAANGHRPHPEPAHEAADARSPG
jgi:chromosome segregation ATPase